MRIQFQAVSPDDYDAPPLALKHRLDPLVATGVPSGVLYSIVAVVPRLDIALLLHMPALATGVDMQLHDFLCFAFTLAAHAVVGIGLAWNGFGNLLALGAPNCLLAAVRSRTM